MAQVKKVGGTTGDKVKKTKVERPEFDLATATNEEGKAVAGRTDGKLQGIPYNFDSKKFKGLKGTAFADKSTFMEFRAWQMELGIQDKLAAIAKMRKDAVKLRSMGDEATRKKASRLMKHRSALAALEAELSEDGFDLSLLDED